MNAITEAADIRIERATRVDLPEIAVLASQVWRAHYPGIISSAQIDYMLGRMYDLGVLARELGEGVVYLRATADQQCVGFASVGAVTETEYKLHKLYVHPQQQGRGVGSALLDHVEKLARDAGAQTLILNVNKQNDCAIGVYIQKGFTIRESVVIDIGEGFVMDDYIMQKQL